MLNGFVYHIGLQRDNQRELLQVETNRDLAITKYYNLNQSYIFLNRLRELYFLPVSRQENPFL